MSDAEAYQNMQILVRNVAVFLPENCPTNGMAMRTHVHRFLFYILIA